jgi:glycosyltransferase involved in cell wall biosynthesis
MNIGFEAKRFFTNFTGLGNYSRFIVDALSRFQPENEYFLYTPRNSDHHEVTSIISRPNIHTVEPRGLASLPGFSSMWRIWGIAAHEPVKNLSIFHGLSQELPVGLPSNVKKVVTVHDLIFLRFPRFYNPIDVRIYFKKVQNACEIADCIVAISEQTAEDIASFLKIAPGKIRVVYQGCQPEFKTSLPADVIGTVKKKYGLPERYILNVGTIEERKNLEVVVHAMAMIPESARIPVVVVGRPTRYLKKIITMISTKKLSSWFIFLHQASFSDFPALYQGASIFVYPSLFEGFGIPLIEAVASGVPVVTSKGSCFVEAAGPDSTYIDPKDPHELAEALKTTMADDFRRKHMITRGKSHIERFEPPRIASSLMDVYRSLL